MFVLVLDVKERQCACMCLCVIVGFVFSSFLLFWFMFWVFEIFGFAIFRISFSRRCFFLFLVACLMFLFSVSFCFCISFLSYLCFYSSFCFFFSAYFVKASSLLYHGHFLFFLFSRWATPGCWKGQQKARVSAIVFLIVCQPVSLCTVDQNILFLTHLFLCGLRGLEFSSCVTTVVKG